PAAAASTAGTAAAASTAGAAAAPGEGWTAGAAAGFFLGMAFAVRPQNVFFLAAGAGYLLLRGGDPGRQRRSALGFVLGVAPPVAATLAYNLHWFGTLLGGYGHY